MTAMASRPSLRVALISALLIALFFFAFNHEPRKTAYSCRTLGSCLGLDKHTYSHTLDNIPSVLESEFTLKDGTLRFDRSLQGTTPDILFLLLNRDENSWSADFRSTQRTAHDFLDVLISTNLNMTDVSFSIMTSSESEYTKLKEITSTLPFARVSIFYQPDTGPEMDYKERHKTAVQLQRRSKIAKLRNYLMHRAIQDESHLFWVDADIVEFSPNIVQTMLKHSTTNPDAGIITAFCKINTMANYDKNAWSLDRSVTSLLGPISDDAIDETVQKLVDTRKLIPSLIENTKDSEIKPLDSVGGTILYIRSDLVRQGVNFPWFNIVGTTWKGGGWIGIETEGICYGAERLMGKGMCWVLGGGHFVRHSDWA